MKDIRIIQVDMGDMSLEMIRDFCRTLESKLPDDVLITVHRGDSGKLSSINVDDIISIKCSDDVIDVTGEDLYEAIKNIVKQKEDR